MKARFSIKIFGVVAAILTPSIVLAEMLDEPACNSLKNEQARLAAEGLKTEMLHGPDWAKANLPASRLEQIKHLIEVEEQIAFRCPLPPPPKPAQPAAAAPSGDDGAVKPGRKKSRKKDSGEAAATDPAPAEQAEPKPAKKKQKSKRKTKEPANDAFVPPPPSGNAFVDGEAGPVPQPAPAPKLAP